MFLICLHLRFWENAPQINVYQLPHGRSSKGFIHLVLSSGVMGDASHYLLCDLSYGLKNSIRYNGCMDWWLKSQRKWLKAL